MKQKLGFHKYCLPRLIQELEMPDFSPSGNYDDVYKWKEAGDEAIIFDCRSIPPLFIEHTGDAAIDEIDTLRQVVRLPYKNCYFEFENQFGVLAYESGDVPAVFFRLFPPGFGEGYIMEEFGLGVNNAGNIIYGEFENEFAEDEPWGSAAWNTESPEDQFNVNTAVKYLTGVLTLLNEHLVATEIRPDPAPALTKARAKKGLPPVTSETRVLTINTAAVRRVAARTKLKSHESPRLHWRRGHWRILHRFSEFETRTWIRRCLVGDPDRGFVNKDYRIVWNQPMIH